MAEPLTSTDIIRERMGFGVSPFASGETRRAYMEAGLSPLGTKERERFEEGRGLSPMASQQEKQAWVAAEVMTGKRSPMDLPEAYGGLGERPEATTRRGLRMQEEWDKQYAMMMEQQKVARETEDNAKRLEILQRDQELQESDYYYNRGLKEAEQKLQLEQRSQAANIVNGIVQLDPRSPDFRKGVAEVFGKNQLGSIDKGALEVAEKYGAVNDLYMESLTKQSEEKKKEEEQQAQIQADIVKYDLTPEQQSKMLVDNLPAGVIKYDPNKAKPIIAEAEKTIEATKETKTKEEETATRFDDYNKALAAYDELVSAGARVDPEDVAKARAEVRGAAAILRLPKVTSEEDLKNYKSGDKVLAPDGITVIDVP